MGLRDGPIADFPSRISLNLLQCMSLLLALGGHRGMSAPRFAFGATADIAKL
jgi:hypothetical protein